VKMAQNGKISYFLRVWYHESVQDAKGVPITAIASRIRLKKISS
jgi:hypothetical protein